MFSFLKIHSPDQLIALGFAPGSPHTGKNVPNLEANVALSFFKGILESRYQPRKGNIFPREGRENLQATRLLGQLSMSFFHHAGKSQIVQASPLRGKEGSMALILQRKK